MIKKSVFLVVPLSLSCLVKICFPCHSSVIVLGSDSDSIFRVKVLVSLSTCTNFLFVIWFSPWGPASQICSGVHFHRSWRPLCSRRFVHPWRWSAESLWILFGCRWFFLHRRFSRLRFCSRAVVFVFHALGLRSGLPFFDCFVRTGFMLFCRSASCSCWLDSCPIPRPQRRPRPRLILLLWFLSWQIDWGSGPFQSACCSSVSGIAAWFSLCSTLICPRYEERRPWLLLVNPFRRFWSLAAIDFSSLPVPLHWILFVFAGRSRRRQSFHRFRFLLRFQVCASVRVLLKWIDLSIWFSG
jgi:hypothetical protein